MPITSSSSILYILHVVGLIDCTEDDFYDPQMFMDGAFQVIKWQAFQQNKWSLLLDEHGKELYVMLYEIDLRI